LPFPSGVTQSVLSSPSHDEWQCAVGIASQTNIHATHPWL
jgi:hypothetical protein